MTVLDFFRTSSTCEPDSLATLIYYLTNNRNRLESQIDKHWQKTICKKICNEIFINGEKICEQCPLFDNDRERILLWLYSEIDKEFWEEIFDGN